MSLRIPSEFWLGIPWGALRQYVHIDYHNAGRPHWIPEGEEMYRSRWDATEWVPPERFPDLPKPTWDQILFALASRFRASLPRYQDSLRVEYERRVRRHADGADRVEDIQPLIDYLTRRGRSAEAVLVSAWGHHLFGRYLEIRHAIEHGDDETLAGFLVCSGPRIILDHIWQYDPIWTDAFWRPHPSLPFFDNHAAVARDHVIADRQPPPTGLIMAWKDDTSLTLRPSTPCSVVLSDGIGADGETPPPGYRQLWANATTLAFDHPHTRTIIAERPLARGDVILADMRAHGALTSHSFRLVAANAYAVPLGDEEEGYAVGARYAAATDPDDETE